MDRLRRPLTYTLGPEVMTPSELAQALEQSSLAQAHSVALALQEGWHISVAERSGSCAELAAIYSLRLQHMRKKSSAHAVQLAVSTEEFVANLREQGGASGMWFTVSGPAEHEFVVFCSASGKPLGCMRTVSQLRVSQDRWNELWSEA